MGALLGFGVGYAIDPGGDVPRLQAAGISALLGGLAGATIGALEKVESWREISYEELLSNK